MVVSITSLCRQRDDQYSGSVAFHSSILLFFYSSILPGDQAVQPFIVAQWSNPRTTSHSGRPKEEMESEQSSRLGNPTLKWPHRAIPPHPEPDRSSHCGETGPGTCGRTLPNNAEDEDEDEDNIRTEWMLQNSGLLAIRP